MKIRLFPFAFGNPSNGVSAIVLGYFKTQPNGLPVNLNDAYQSSVSRIITDDTTVPVAMEIDRKTFNNNVRPWYRCLDTADETEDKFQGALVAVSNVSVTTTALTFFVEMSYTVEFRGPCDPVEESIFRLWKTISLKKNQTNNNNKKQDLVITELDLSSAEGEKEKLTDAVSTTLTNSLSELTGLMRDLVDTLSLIKPTTG